MSSRHHISNGDTGNCLITFSSKVVRIICSPTVSTPPLLKCLRSSPNLRSDLSLAPAMLERLVIASFSLDLPYAVRSSKHCLYIYPYWFFLQLSINLLLARSLLFQLNQSRSHQIAETLCLFQPALGRNRLFYLQS